jgi:hypothetical protein
MISGYGGSQMNPLALLQHDATILAELLKGSENFEKYLRMVQGASVAKPEA